MQELSGDLLDDGKDLCLRLGESLDPHHALDMAWSATYNGDGARLRQVTNGVPTTYTLDLAAPLVQVLAQQDASGTTRYLYGVTRIGEEQPGGWAYHSSDALGRLALSEAEGVRQLADDGAQVTLARTYDPLGQVIALLATRWRRKKDKWNGAL